MLPLGFGRQAEAPAGALAQPLRIGIGVAVTDAVHRVVGALLRVAAKGPATGQRGVAGVEQKRPVLAVGHGKAGDAIAVQLNAVQRGFLLDPAAVQA
ncbi:hypothetical protein D3C77_590650 [compost metagenome]